MSESKSFQERWEWITTYMVLVDKFVHHVLMMMDKVEKEDIPFMAISVDPLRVTLYYNKEKLEPLKDSEICFILTHEIYHVVLHHCTSRRPTDLWELSISNYAHDMAINCLIVENKYRAMPRDNKGKTIGILPSTYDYPDKLSYDQYLTMLKEDLKKEKKRREGQGTEGEGDGNGEGTNKSGGNSSKNRSAISDLLDEIEGNKEVVLLDGHGEWQEGDIIDEIIRNKVRNIMSNGKVWGSLPGDLQAIIAAAQETKVSWERYLKFHIGNIISPTYTRTITKPDKRFGYPYLGKKRGYSDKKLVAIDTSGSISDENLAQFLAEINNLVEIMPVDLVLFDTSITLGPIMYHNRHISFDFKGRGGTDFAPVFKLAEEQHYQSVIILTDGYAPEIEYPQGVKDVIWVLTEENDPPVDWGIRVHIEE